MRPAIWAPICTGPFIGVTALRPEVTEGVLGRGHEYLRRTTGVPTDLSSHQAWRFTADRRQCAFQVITGGGHALEQAMLYRPEDRSCSSRPTR